MGHAIYFESPGRYDQSVRIALGSSKEASMMIVYGALCVLGTALPLGQFIPWAAEHSFNLSAFVS